MENKSPFIGFMGDSPTIRVLDYLLTERELDFSITDIAENADIEKATLYGLWDKLIENRIIIHTRDIGKAKLFKLNVENPKIKKLMEIDDILITENLKKRSENMKIEVSV